LVIKQLLLKKPNDLFSSINEAISILRKYSIEFIAVRGKVSQEILQFCEDNKIIIISKLLLSDLHSLSCVCGGIVLSSILDLNTGNFGQTVILPS
jgi:hypothetical protein